MKLIKVSFLMVACLLVVFFIITSCAGNPIIPNTPETNIIVATGTEGLLIFDVSNPTNPQQIGRLNTNGLALGVYVSGNYAYVADKENGLVIIDISNPTNPQQVGHCDTNGYASDVYVSGNYAYIADGGNGLVIIDISDPTNPTLSSDMFWGVLINLTGY